MMIKASVPVERVELAGGGHRYRYEIRELEVKKVFRNPVSYANRHLNRWHYQAEIVPPIDMPDDYIKNFFKGRVTVSIVRRGLNDKWVPPVFEKGFNVCEICN